MLSRKISDRDKGKGEPGTEDAQSSSYREQAVSVSLIGKVAPTQTPPGSRVKK